MTAADLLSDPGFLGFCKAWQDDGRCPLIFADWLRDRDLEGAADAAEWAANEPDRPRFYCNPGVNMSGAYPERLEWNDGDVAWAWGTWRDDFQGRSRCYVPPEVFAALPAIPNHGYRGAQTFPAAIAAFLDAWAAARVPA